MDRLFLLPEGYLGINRTLDTSGYTDTFPRAYFQGSHFFFNFLRLKKKYPQIFLNFRKTSLDCIDMLLTVFLGVVLFFLSF